MDEATIALTIMTGLIGLSLLGFLIWGIKSKQFKNIEDAKYQVLGENPQDGAPSDSPEKDHQNAAGGDRQ
jgi:nitrogen fixation-related uncharacterized protein